jgi:hypothetical protein
MEVIKETHQDVRTSGASAPGGIDHGFSVGNTLFKEENMKTKLAFVFAVIIAGLAFVAYPAFAADKKPNILVIWGDDIGNQNISFNSRGMMGYQTPNIDRIAKEGVGFTDYYAQQSCTAGRAAFIGGSVPVRSGMTKVGLPGAKEGWQKTDVTMATILKSQGYATGQFGKNHPPEEP